MIVRCSSVPANQAGAHKQNAKGEQAAKCQSDQRTAFFAAMHSARTERPFERGTAGSPAVAGRSYVKRASVI